MSSVLRHNAKQDSNQAAIVRDLEAIGCSVQMLGKVGGGCPDLLVGFRGMNVLMEVKNGDTYGKLNQRQRDWHDAWRGQKAVVHNTDEAYFVLGVA